VAFVKLDCGMLDSTTWFDKDARDLFITALLMATPKECLDPQPQLEVDSLDATGWVAPPGWYGHVDAASTGILNRCGMEMDGAAMAALARLGDPELASRSQKNEGRRMIRVDGGFLILNYEDYRAKDHTAAERQRRYRAKKASKSNGVTLRNDTSPSQPVTQAEAEAYKDPKPTVCKCRFEEWWKGYPTKVKKKEARKKWKAKRLSEKADMLIADVANRVANDDQWMRGFVPHPTTYLNGERWNDELTMPEGRQTTEAAAVEHGLTQDPGESDEKFKQRIGVAITQQMYS